MPPPVERAVPAPPVVLKKPRARGGSTFASQARDYLTLTKPRVISLLLLTTLAAMIVAEEGLPDAGLVALTLLGGYLAAGGAGAINHYIERESDGRMGRTRGRPLATGRLEPRRGLIFGVSLGVASMLVLGLGVNLAAALLSLAGLLGYVFVYTLWLKPATPHNIVIGGAAGAIPPLVGWAAVTGGLEAQALWLFAIVFVWTPPHFWALSLLVKSDYERSGTPMLPVVRGEENTRLQILAYAVGLIPLTLAPVATGLFGLPYAIAAVGLGIAFAGLAAVLRRRADRPAARRTYLFSLLYLALLFTAMAIDRLV